MGLHIGTYNNGPLILGFPTEKKMKFLTNMFAYIQISFRYFLIICRFLFLCVCVVLRWCVCVWGGGGGGMCV